MQELISWDPETVNAFECALNMNIGKGAPVNYLSNRCEADVERETANFYYRICTSANDSG